MNSLNQKAILYPVFAQVFLIFIVWFSLLYGRVTTIIRNKIHPQKLADHKQADEIYKDLIHISDNFENLFEIPVLFFLAAIIIYTSQLTDTIYVLAAWGFVALRALHSLIHCTTNRIRHRFMVYALSSFIIWGMWLRLGLGFLF